MLNLTARIRVQRLFGALEKVASEGSGGPLQAKTAWPSHDEQVIAPDEDYYGLVSVKVMPVPRVPACEVSVEAQSPNVIDHVVNIAAYVSVTTEDTSVEYYRLTITEFRRDGTLKTYASVSEFSLYDSEGNNLVSNAFSAEYSANTYSDSPRNAFDGSKSSFWQSDWSGAPNTTNWLQVKVINAKPLTSFGITPRSDYNDFAHAFTLAKSTDGITWNTLAEYSGLSSGWTKGTERLFNLTA